MTTLLILYATREGQTRRIAEHIAAKLRAQELGVELVDARALPPALDLRACSAAVLAASVHFGKHEREMVAFVKTQRAGLERLPTLFLSVSGAEVTAEDASASDETRATAAKDARTAMTRFFTDTGWRPTRASAVAGAMLYTQYDVLTRFVMRQIAKRRGGHVDTSRDTVHTDWLALDRIVGDFVQTAVAQPTSARAPDHGMMK